MAAYNHQKHQSLAKTHTPNEVGLATQIQETVQKLNDDKRKTNNKNSSLKLGDQVKKDILLNDTYTRWTDPKWSDKIFTVREVEGNELE